MKKTSLFVLSSILLLVSCKNEPQFHINGEFKNAADSTVYLYALTDDRKQEVLDSALIESDGAFSLSGKSPAFTDFFVLRVNNHVINFAIDSTETITFKADLKTIDKKYKVEGSENARFIRDIDMKWRTLQQNIIECAKDWSLLPGDAVDSIANMEARFKKHLCTEYIINSPSSAWAYYAACLSIVDNNGQHLLFDYMNERDDARVFAAVATAWDLMRNGSPRTERILEVARKGMESTAPRKEQVLDVDDSRISYTGILKFELLDINGKVRSISSLKGKVVLLDFTRYADKFSSAHNRSLRSLYDKMHTQGLEIMQVSLDTDEHYWKYAAENLPWICVRDTKGEVARLYAVSNLPTYFLIDRNNEIVKRSDDVKDLEAELSALL